VYIDIFVTTERCWSGKRNKINWESSECSMPRKSFCMPEVHQPWPKGWYEGKRSLPITGRGNTKEKWKMKIKGKEKVKKGKRIWPTGCPDMKVNNYQSMQCNIPEEWRSCVYCSRSLRSHYHNTTWCCDTGMDIGLLKKCKIFVARISSYLQLKKCNVSTQFSAATLWHIIYTTHSWS